MGGIGTDNPSLSTSENTGVEMLGGITGDINQEMQDLKNNVNEDGTKGIDAGQLLSKSIELANLQLSAGQVTTMALADSKMKTMISQKVGT